MNPSVINAIPIQCTARVSVTCQEWFKPNPRGRRSTICPACRVQINRDKTAARKRCVKLNSSKTKTLSPKRCTLRKTLFLCRPKSVCIKCKRILRKGPRLPRARAGKIGWSPSSEGSKPDALSLTPPVDSHASLPVPADAVLAPPEDFLEEEPAIFGAPQVESGPESTAEPVRKTQSEFLHKTQLAAPPEESTDERLARILRDGIADLVREGEEDRAQLRARWEASRR